MFVASIETTLSWGCTNSEGEPDTDTSSLFSWVMWTSLVSYRNADYFNRNAAFGSPLSGRHQRGLEDISNRVAARSASEAASRTAPVPQRAEPTATTTQTIVIIGAAMTAVAFAVTGWVRGWWK